MHHHLLGCRGYSCALPYGPVIVPTADAHRRAPSGITGKLGVPLLLLLARLLIGIGQCNNVAVRSYICRVTTHRTRTPAIVMITAVEASG
jgi:hypothetical protein